MTLAANVTAKKGDTILNVLPCGTVWEVLVLSWGKKRATLINKDAIGKIHEDHVRYHCWLENGEIVQRTPIENLSSYYKNI